MIQTKEKTQYEEIMPKLLTNNYLKKKKKKNKIF